MAITFEQFFFECLGKTQKTQEELQVLFNQYEPMLRQMVAKQWRAELWDGTKMINGVLPDQVRESYGMGPEDVAYLLYWNDQLVYFQPHGINSEKVTRDNWQDLAKKHIEQKVDEIVIGKLLQIAGVV